MKENKLKKLLTPYLLGDLDDATRAEVEACLERSESCRAEAREIEPTLDLLRSALVAPEPASERLSAERRAKILASGEDTQARGAAKPGILRWVTDGWPGLSRAAALLLVCGVIAGLLIPSLTKSHRHATTESEAALGFDYAVSVTSGIKKDSPRYASDSDPFARADTDGDDALGTWDARHEQPAEAGGTDFDMHWKSSSGEKSSVVDFSDTDSDGLAFGNGDRAGAAWYRGGEKPKTTRGRPERDFDNDTVDLYYTGAAAGSGARPAEPDAIETVKSPVVMRGIYGSRNPGKRGSAPGGETETLATGVGGGGGRAPESKNEVTSVNVAGFNKAKITDESDIKLREVRFEDFDKSLGAGVIVNGKAAADVNSLGGLAAAENATRKALTLPRAPAPTTKPKPGIPRRPTPPAKRPPVLEPSPPAAKTATGGSKHGENVLHADGTVQYERFRRGAGDAHGLKAMEDAGKPANAGDYQASTRVYGEAGKYDGNLPALRETRPGPVDDRKLNADRWETAQYQKRIEHVPLIEDLPRSESRRRTDTEKPPSDSGMKTESEAIAAEEMVPLKLELPKPLFVGTPKKIKSGNLEAYPYAKPEPGETAAAAEPDAATRYSTVANNKRPGREADPMDAPDLPQGQVVLGPGSDDTDRRGQKVVAKDALPALGDAPALGRLFRADEKESEENDAGLSTMDLGQIEALKPRKALLGKEGLRREEQQVAQHKAAQGGGDETGEQALTKGLGHLRDHLSMQERTLDEAVTAESIVGYAGATVDQPTKPTGSEIKKKVDALIEEEVEQEPEDPTRFRAFGVNPFYAVNDQAFSTFSIDVDTAAYTVGRRYMSQGFLPPAEAVRTEEFVNFFDYGYEASPHRTFTIHTDCAPSRFGRGLHLLKIGVKGRRLGREEQRQAALTFLIDTSGSMDKPDRMGLVQQSLKLLLSKLDIEDRVAIIQYASHARIVIDHTAVRDRAKILAAIDALQCGGSTNLEEGMRRAYQLAAAAFVAGGENRVLLLSDGVANLGTGDAADILKQIERYRKQGITCSVFGFGMGTYDDEMLETLANKGDGNYTFIDSREQAQRVFVDDLAATLNTIAADVKIQVEFDPKRVKRYRQLGYENRQLAKEDFRNDAVDAGEVGSGQSVTALYEVELADTTSRAPLCVVRVRYRRVDTGAVEEIEEPLKSIDWASDFNKATAHFRLAACVAEFAEILRGSPYAGGSEYADIADVLRPVALDLDLDTRVQELLRLVQGAGSMSRGE